MQPDDVIELGRHAVIIMLLVSSPILVAGMVVGLLIGLFQALTQIQEQTVAFVPKIVAMMLALTITLPWLVYRMVEYSRELIRNIPELL